MTRPVLFGEAIDELVTCVIESRRNLTNKGVWQMKNKFCFAAVTFAMTVAGACVGYGLRETPEIVALVTFVIAMVGGLAAMSSGDTN